MSIAPQPKAILSSVGHSYIDTALGDRVTPSSQATKRASKGRTAGMESVQSYSDATQRKTLSVSDVARSVKNLQRFSAGCEKETEMEMQRVKSDAH